MFPPDEMPLPPVAVWLPPALVVPPEPAPAAPPDDDVPPEPLALLERPGVQAASATKNSATRVAAQLDGIMPGQGASAFKGNLAAWVMRRTTGSQPIWAAWDSATGENFTGR